MDASGNVVSAKLGAKLQNLSYKGNTVAARSHITKVCAIINVTKGSEMTTKRVTKTLIREQITATIGRVFNRNVAEKIAMIQHLAVDSTREASFPQIRMVFWCMGLSLTEAFEATRVVLEGKE